MYARSVREPLPKGYKHNWCESCRNKAIHGIKDGGKKALGVAARLVAMAITILSKGKISPKNSHKSLLDILHIVVNQFSSSSRKINLDLSLMVDT